MIIQKKLIFLFACFCLVLAGCGGSTTGGNDSGDGGVDGDTGGGGDTQRVVRFGSFDAGGNFTEGQISTKQNSIIAGESASLSASLIDEDGSPVTDAADVFFSSQCIGMGTSDIDPPVAANTAGTVSATYTARGCSSADTVTASTSIDGNSLSSTVTIQTQQAPLGSIQF